MGGTGPSDSRTYRAYAVTLASTIDLPELPQDPSAQPRLRVTQALASDGGKTDAISPADGNAVISQRTNGGYLLRFPGSADFALSADCRRIECRPFSDVPSVTLRHLLIDHVIPTALAGSGELVLHASGVVLPRGAVLILGPSGAGKSTLAAVLARRGRPVLSDDAARLVEEASRFVVAPSYPGLRLWPDGIDVLVGERHDLGEVAHDSPKRRWIPEGELAQSVDLACAFILDDSDDVRVGPISAREALFRTLDQSYGLPLGGADHVRHQFDRIDRLVTSYPFFRLSYPYDFSRLNEVADLVEAHASDVGSAV